MKYIWFPTAALACFLLTSPLKAEEAADKTADKPDKNAETYRLLNLFGDVFERVRSDYVEAPTDQDLIESAITGMLSALDPHSSYLNAKSYQEMQVQTKGEFGGLGIQVTMSDGLVKVISPIDDTPAFHAGIMAGDLITHLDNVPVQGMTLAQAVDKMRGRVGTDLVLTIMRKDSKPFDVTLTRAIVKVDSVRSNVDGKIGYLRITSFNEQSDKGVKKAMDDFKAKLGSELQGIVLDLRNNPGGLLDQAVNVSDAFLDKGEIVSTRSRYADKTQRYNARPGDEANGLPIVVLINGGSASASEIVAGALQDHRRAIVLGVKSFGKGSVQTVIPLSGQGAMRLTTARYYTPSGTSIQGMGITPDIIVEQAKIELLEKGEQRREADLRGALENENGKGTDGDKGGDNAAKDPGLADDKKKKQDYQLERAFDLLRGMSLYADRLAGKPK
ncbi:MAG: peptidase S41 [Rhodospirillales bacterium RIFCSPLOWO2_12_FULL_58_28]|nr:MAG: peptidase S41 [Rhodospirillales bacterium RIFCSPLOWO2_02_FULL_58_16]OHC79248.1 MAG: peptidase S41 [Rhodospirillales bacterium RIFCSPLOWO2_12_FULL_58_28]